MEIKFKKVHTVKDLAISAIVRAAGIGLFFLNAGLGIVVAVCGLLLLLFFKQGYKREGEDILLTKDARDIAHACRQSLKEFLDGLSTEPEVKPAENGGVIRLETLYNRDQKVAYARIFDFSNYAYEPATDIVELRGPRAEILIEKLT